MSSEQLTHWLFAFAVFFGGREGMTFRPSYVGDYNENPMIPGGYPGIPEWTNQDPYGPMVKS